MKKIIEKTIIIIAIAFITLLLLSYFEIIAKNTSVNPVYSDWNIIYQFTKWACHINGIAY